MLWEIEVRPTGLDRDGQRVLHECREFRAASITSVQTAHLFLLQGPLSREDVSAIADGLLVDRVVESARIASLSQAGPRPEPQHPATVCVLYKPGVSDNVADTVLKALREQGRPVEHVRTGRKFWLNPDAKREDVGRVASRILANEAIQQVVWGELRMDGLGVGSEYRFQKVVVPLRDLDDAALTKLSRNGQLSMTLPEMQTVQRHFREQGRDPTDAELETIAQTWSEHCSHKTLRGRVRYREGDREQVFENLLKETIFCRHCRDPETPRPRRLVRQRLPGQCRRREVRRHTACLLQGRDAQPPLGHRALRRCEHWPGRRHPGPAGHRSGREADLQHRRLLLCPPDLPDESLPPGVLHPRIVMQGVVSGVRDYGNRMGIPTVNGAILFDERYLGNPLVFCGNVATIPVGKVEKASRRGITSWPSAVVRVVMGSTARRSRPSS